MRCALLLAALTQLSALNSQLASAALFTNSTTITEANLAYDGQDIVISGAGVTVAIDGAHAFNSNKLSRRVAVDELREIARPDEDRHRLGIEHFNSNPRLELAVFLKAKPRRASDAHLSCGNPTTTAPSWLEGLRALQIPNKRHTHRSISVSTTAEERSHYPQVLAIPDR